MKTQEQIELESKTYNILYKTIQEGASYELCFINVFLIESGNYYGTPLQETLEYISEQENIDDRTGISFYVSVKEMNNEIIQYLIGKGADINCESYLRSKIIVMMNYINIDIIDKLFAYGSVINNLSKNAMDSINAKLRRKKLNKILNIIQNQ